MVSDLLLPDSGAWNTSLIRHLFPNSVASAILSFERPLRNIDDFVYWKYTRDGSFLTKTAYTGFLIQHFNLLHSSPASWCWKRFWGLPILPKWKMLAWKVLYSSLPVADLLKLKGIPINSTCVFCHVSSESVGYLFRDCPLSRHLWDSFSWESLPKPEAPLSFLVSFSAVISRYVTTKNWSALDRFFGICWAIWLTRNSVRFRSTVYSPDSILHIARDWWDKSGKARDFSDSLNDIPLGFSYPFVSQVLRGNPNVPDIVIMHFDGAWDQGNYNAGIGWCFWDTSSFQSIGGGARACMAASALHSELQACLFGLRHALQSFCLFYGAWHQGNYSAATYGSWFY
ncbi:uncharacterized protein LOC110695481 [Chenopodium quinoa]|uniref:uncharacterized protein LOC110695481 n=1 Tax=Chenopodium quinoa TaxID=63459 RepID=UPI000B78146F|nr:uncharacterized protein LOC110695481 [Chenopodium quinoa]